MKSPWENFNKAMTFQREELIVWSGFSGSGKSTLLNHVVAQGLLQNEKFAICSMEMPSKTTLYRMVRQFTGEKCPTSDRIYNTMHWLNDKLWMIDVLGVMKVERMLEVIKYAVKRYNIRNFIIDSLTKCGIREDDYDGQKALVDALTDFCHQYECTVHLVVHQRKPMSNKERPDKFGARGAAAITDEANSVICVYRNSAEGDQDQFKRRKIVETTPHLDQPDTIISIEKNRETGIEGKFDLYFDSDSLQFHEVRQAPIDYTLQIESAKVTSSIIQEEF
jgi:twinkle protein